MIDGKELVAVEDLAGPDGALHPVQDAVLRHHGSQCGFCTPGIVMSLFTLYHAGGRGDRQAVNDALAGNLCRCTGYRPIVDAALEACAGTPRDAFAERRAVTVERLAALDDSEDLFIGDEATGFFAAPATVEALARLYARHPDATLVAGATDVGLWITKQMRALPKIVHLGRAIGLADMREIEGGFNIGAGVTYERAESAMAAIDPDLVELFRRLGAKQVRAVGTLGGNIANGSPIGDTMPALIALGATLHLRRGQATRSMPLEEFFIDYGKQDLAAGEFVTGIDVPRLKSDEVFRCYKISKRFDQDISALLGAFRFTVEAGRVTSMRVSPSVAWRPRRNGPPPLKPPSRACGLRTSAAGTPPARPWRRTFGPSTTCGPAPRTGWRRRRRSCARPCTRRAAKQAPRPGSWACGPGGRSVPPDVPQPDRTAPADGNRSVGRALAHDSALWHVQGTARFIDDIPEPAALVHVAPGYAAHAARGRITALDLDAVRAAPGVVAVLTAADIPGRNDCSPVFGDDPILAEDRIAFHGQVVFAVAALSRDEARRACRQARITVEEETPRVSVEAGLASGETVLPDYQFLRGEPLADMKRARHTASGSLHVGGQEHFYLEGQVAMALPGEGGAMHVLSSTQHPTEIQHLVAGMLEKPDSDVVCECRRMGGAFGGKESQAAQWACLAALAASVTGSAAKLRLDRDDDMIMTGKRHDFRVDYSYGCDDTGRLLAVDAALNARCGYSADLSMAVCDRAMFHADNAYYYPSARILSRRVRTDTVSNTAFRGFGGPQGMMLAERMMDDIACRLGLDPLDVRKRNLYGRGRDVTPYGMKVGDNTLSRLVRELEKTSGYRERRKGIAAFNENNRFLRKGMSLTPVKFGIAFTLKHLNQAGALVHVYTDGSVLVNHGGTEMGQGLHTKVAQVVAQEFGIGFDRVRITATKTDMVPNTTPTAASSGSDLNGMAAKRAAATIKDRMAALAGRLYQVPKAEVRFAGGTVAIGGRTISFAELAKTCFLERVSLSSTGYFATPKITWDRASASGRPFLYFAYGAACSEVTIDTLTGEMRVDRIDLLHDVGNSLNPAIDIGQIEGGFVQGMGWLTTEELVFDAKGRLTTHAPSTYKIPVASDVPEDFRVALWESKGNREATIYRSKAVGEPPLMLAISVFSAISNAIASLNPGRVPALDAPATPEAIARAIRSMRDA